MNFKYRVITPDRLGLFSLALFAVLSLLVQMAPQHASADGLPAYTLISIPSAVAGQSSFGSAINASGAIAGGSAQASGNDQAIRILTPANGPVPPTALLSHLPGGDFSDGFDINDAGDVCGSSRATGTTTFSGRAAAWRAGSSAAIDLGTLGGPGSVARAISNTGVVVGVSDTPGGGFRAFRYDLNAATPSMQAIDLGPELGGGASTALDISPDGAFIVGSARGTGTAGKFLPFVQFSGSTMALPLLPGTSAGTAQAVNNGGTVGGSCDKPGGGTLACVWTKTMTGDYVVNPVPGIPADSSFSDVMAINASGDYVGNILGPSPGFSRSAFGLIRGTLLTNLNALLGTRAPQSILTAEGIDEQRRIAGTAVGGVGLASLAYVLQEIAFPTPDLAVTMKFNAVRVNQGATVQLEVSIKNLGPGLADNFEVLVSRVAGFTPTRVSAPGGHLDLTSPDFGVVVSDLGPLGTGATAKIVIDYQLATDTEVGVQEFSALVRQFNAAEQELSDPNTTNDEANTTLEVQAAPPPGAADVSIKGPAGPIVVPVGKTATLAFGVSNGSRVNAALQQVLRIQLPAALRIESVKPPQGSTVTREGGLVTVSGTTLAKGKTETTQVKVTAVTPTPGAELTAGVTTTSPDPTPGNNAYSATVVASGPDLTVQLEKVDQKKPATSRMVSISGKIVNKGKGGTSTGVSGRVVLVKPGGETTVLGPLTGGSIGANGSRPFKGNFTLPKGVDPATAMIRVEVDPENEIPEENEANNSAQKSIKLLPPGR